MPAYIAGTGFYNPDERLTNADLERMVATTDAWIQEKTGIVERRKLPAGLMASDLGVPALRRAAAAARWSLEDVDLLVCATSSPDTLVPSTACHIGRKLGISPTAFDINAACSGFLYGLAVVAPMVESGRYHRAALVAAEHYTRFTNYEDRATCIFWGDAGAAAMIQAELPERGGFEIVDVITGAITEGTDYVRIPIWGYIEQEGKKVKEYALRGFMESARTILERNNVDPSQLAGFVGHQANYRLLEILCQELGVHQDRHWHTVRYFGNQGAAGAPSDRTS